MILDLLNTYVKLSGYNFEKHQDDNVVDKLIRKFTAIMMIIFASLVGISQLVGKPIECWCPNDYSGSRCKYAINYCYITSFYIPVSNSTDLPKREDLESHKILYYQWVPFIFLFQAFLFYLPSLIWRALNSRSEFSLRDYIQTLKMDDGDSKNSLAVEFVSLHIQTCLNFKNSYISRGRVKKTLYKGLHLRIFNCGYYLWFSYILTKFFYLGVIVLQLFMLNYWLKDEHYKGSFLLGWHNWRFTERFPRMTLCKFSVYILQDSQPQWVQCTLPINIYIEKMYIIIWIWLCVLLLLVLADIFRYLRFMCCSTRLISKELRTHELNADSDQISQFIGSIKADTSLVLSLIKANTNRYYASNIINKLFESYKKIQD